MDGITNHLREIVAGAAVLCMAYLFWKYGLRHNLLKSKAKKKEEKEAWKPNRWAVGLGALAIGIVLTSYTINAIARANAKEQGLYCPATVFAELDDQYPKSINAASISKGDGAGSLNDPKRCKTYIAGSDHDKGFHLQIWSCEPFRYRYAYHDGIGNARYDPPDSTYTCPANTTIDSKKGWPLIEVLVESDRGPAVQGPAVFVKKVRLRSH